MNTMNALVYYGPNDLRLEKRPIPSAKPGEVLIKVKAVSICGSDLGAYRLKSISDRWQPPLILGHEFSGEIVGLGEGVNNFNIGQPVTANPIIPCGKCYYCQRGQINLCPERFSLGTSIGNVRHDGAMREYMTVRASSLYPLLEGVNFTQGALMEPLAVSYCASKVGGWDEEENVAVIGVGPIGLMILKYLKMNSNKKVFISDVVPCRLDLAKVNGADEIIDGHSNVIAKLKELTQGVGVDRVIITAGVPGIFEKSLEMVRNGGRIVIVALSHHKAELDLIPIVSRGLSIFGSYMFTNEIAEVMDLVANKKIEVDDLITSINPLTEAIEVFNNLSDKDCKDIKVILTNN